MTDPAIRMRCGECLAPYREHLPRFDGEPMCANRTTVYREGTEAELFAAYDKAFPNGPEPIATFRTDSPEDMERAKAVLSPEALTGFFGAGGGGMPAFQAALEGKPPPHPGLPVAIVHKARSVSKDHVSGVACGSTRGKFTITDSEVTCPACMLHAQG